MPCGPSIVQGGTLSMKRFVVILLAVLFLSACGAPPTSAPTETARPTSTPQPTNTTQRTSTNTPRSTNTTPPTDPPPTSTVAPTETPQPTNTPRPTSTPQPTNTLRPTDPPVPTAAPTQPIPTAAPTQPPQPTAVPANLPTAAPPPQTGSLVITNVNKRDEYVDIHNNGGDVDLAGWILRSEKGSQDCPLGGVLAAGQSLRIHALAEDAGLGGFNCGFGGPIWNNSESDPAVLINPQGVEVSRR